MFILGQRWISEAEPDLGLGSVVGIEGRMVRLAFAATGEQRTYAQASAPLSRVSFGEGESIQDQQGRMLLVEQVSERAGLLEYQCTDAAGEAVQLPEQMLSDRMRLNRPQDRLLSLRIDPDIWFGLRYTTWRKNAEVWRSSVFGLTGPRVELVPHQLFIAHEVSSRNAPRVLLADEVGLGKTIEAGLIMHRLLLAERVRRVLVVVPEALLHQWLVEMLRRFNLRFAIFDEERFRNSDHANPFHAEQRVLCSLGFLTGSGDVARAALEGEWDLLVVDEAHHLQWSPQEASLEYELIEALAGAAPGVLLLTATPEQLGRTGHFARLRLLDPQRFHSYQVFLDEEQHYQPVARLAARLLEQQPLSDADRTLLRELLGDVDLHDSQALIEHLVDRHGTGRVLLRNTRHAIKGFPGRRAIGYPLPLHPDYVKHKGENTPETCYPRKWTRIDPRVPWLLEHLRELAPHKVLVICAHAKTVIGLREYLRDTEGMHVAMFHEGMEIVERDRAAVYFADTEEGSQALLCSEIGSEGRNFQFAHHLVLFDLPLVPDLLEQRIGRLDRIGQTENITIHVPYMEGAASEVLFRWYDQALGAFDATCAAASAVFGQLGDQLRQTLGDADGLPVLLEQGRELTGRLNAELELGRDRLLEIHSHNPQVSAELVDAIATSDGDRELKHFMRAFWEAYGVSHNPGRGRSDVVRAGAHMRHEHFPGLPQDGVTVTWDRQDALTHEDREFLTWEHPMVRGAMEMLISAELGSASVIVCSHPDYATGTLFLELLYVAECLAPANLESQRYLPPTCQRLLLDTQGVERGAELPHEQLSGMDLAHNKKLAETVIKSQGPRLKLLFQVGEELAQKQSGALIDQSIAAMQATLDDELERLRGLARVNPNVREDEIEQIAARRELLTMHLKEVRVRLDAARVVVMR